MSNAKQRFGRWGEDAAAQYLVVKGYTIVARNVHSAHGELDIIASKGGVLVFVEVKARSSHSFAYPEDSVTRRKQAFLLSAAEAYLQAHPDGGDSWQFDVIAVEGRPGGKAVIEEFGDL